MICSRWGRNFNLIALSPKKLSVCSNKSLIKIISLIVIFFLVAFIPFSGFAQSSVSVGAETYQPAVNSGDAQKNSAARLRHPAAPVNYPRIILEPLSAAEKQATLENGEKKQKVGIGRVLPDEDDFVSSLLEWVTLSDGAKVASFVVKSTAAQSLRLKLVFGQLPDGMELRFYDPQQVYETAGPVTTSDILRSTGSDAASGYWSPTMPGDSIGVEIYLPAAVDSDSLQFSVPLLSHLFSTLLPDSDKNLADIDASQSCHIDVACVSGLPQSIIDSVAKYEYTENNGSTFLCTGTLLADNDSGSFIPYFLTANHCIDNQPEAASMQLYWFFQRAGCSGPDPVSISRQTGGAALFSTAADTDFSLLRLNQNPPAGAGLSGWTGSPVAASSPVFGIHHPNGDLKKFNSGTALGFAPFLEAINGTGPYIYTQWLEGATEPGSSGSGLWLQDDGQNTFLVGILAGGEASCSTPAQPDYYGRFDLVFPLIEPWLDPAANPLSTVWWDPDRSGQAVQLVQNNKQISGAWYLYDESARGMWVTFVGELNGTTVTASLLRFSGPPLGEVWDDAEVQSAVVGNVTIDFSSARAAGFSYTIDGVSDSLNLQPFNPLAGGIYSKVWWDPNRSGQAVQILHENNQISGAWYVYDENGEGMWTTFSGTLAAGSITTELLRFSGPPLGSIWDENQVSSRVAGSIKLNFQSETAASMTYTLNGITGSLALQPFNL